jgi:hypothetical protein
MLESGSSGSVRGVLSNEHPYRDPKQFQIRIRKARCARVVHEPFASKTEGVGECRVPAAPAASRAKCEGGTRA